MKLYISPTQAIDIMPEKDVLGTDIAVRSRAMDWWGMFGYLPDPDPVLQKLGLAVDAYRELLTDAHVWSCYDSRKSGALSCEWELRAGGDARADKKALALAEAVFERLDIYQVVMEMLDAPFYGLSPMEISWRAGEYWIPEKIEGKPPEWFVFDDHNRMRFLSMENMTEGEELPTGKFIAVRHHATYHNPYGERVLSRCFWPVAFKRGGFRFWSIFTEKFGMPWLIGKVPRGTGATDRAQLLSNLVQMVQDAVAVINDDESIAAMEFSSKSASADIYEKLISASNREVSKAILGQTLSTELDKGGSLAATQGHLDVRDDIVAKDKHMVRSAMNRLLRWITELNVAGAQPPVFAWFEEDDVQLDRSERDNNLGARIEFTPAYYQRVYNLEPGDFTLRSRDAGTGGQFAETDPRPLVSAQDRADVIAGRLDTEAGPLTDAMLAPVRDLVAGAASITEIRDGMFDLYPDLPSGDLATLMQQAMAAAELAGRSDLLDEIRI